MSGRAFCVIASLRHCVILLVLSLSVVVPLVKVHATSLYGDADVWTDRPEYSIGETITIYAKTPLVFCVCHYWLTIYGPDGTQVTEDLGQLDPGTTTSRSSYAGLPPGERKVELWMGDGTNELVAYTYFNVIGGPAKKVPLGVYVSTWNDKDWSEAELDSLISKLAEHGTKKVYVQLFYPTEIAKGKFRMERAGTWQEDSFEGHFDLNHLIEVAHGAGIEVHGMVDCFGWAEVAVSPTDNKHQEYLLRVVGYLVSTFSEKPHDLDGIQLDRVRYMFERGIKANGDTRTIAEFVAKVKELTAGHMVLSAAVKPASADSEYYTVKYCYGQDYEEMSRYLDFMAPMAYHIDGEFGRKSAHWVGEVTSFAQRKASGKPVLPIVQAFDDITADELKAALTSALDSRPSEVSVFVYQHIVEKRLWCAIDQALSS